MSALLAHNNHLNLGMALSSCDLGRHSPSYFLWPGTSDGLWQRLLFRAALVLEADLAKPVENFL
jgi:hypothetical protein